jgi:aryl-alcohol dehydrogenase-like predicted oxidoreductase
VPLEESIGALADLRAEGKIRHIGISNVSVDELRRARRLVPIVTVQNRYNYADRSSEEVLRECEREVITFLPWYPLEAGRSASITGTLARIAARHNASPAQIAIAWLLARSPITLPIPGTSSVAHLEENVTAIRIRLSPPELAELS